MTTYWRCGESDDWFFAFSYKFDNMGANVGNAWRCYWCSSAWVFKIWNIDEVIFCTPAFVAQTILQPLLTATIVTTNLNNICLYSTEISATTRYNCELRFAVFMCGLPLRQMYRTQISPGTTFRYWYPFRFDTATTDTTLLINNYCSICI